MEISYYDQTGETIYLDVAFEATGHEERFQSWWTRLRQLIRSYDLKTLVPAEPTVFLAAFTHGDTPDRILIHTIRTGHLTALAAASVASPDRRVAAQTTAEQYRQALERMGIPT